MPTYDGGENINIVLERAMNMEEDWLKRISCSYGSHNMIYTYDAHTGKCISSICSICGASYEGFHL